jgi:ketosteroid isomerase-like protein
LRLSTRSLDKREAIVTDSASTKALVQQWFAAGVSSLAGLDMVTDDFVWQGPPSMAEIFEHDDATLRGKSGLSRLSFLDEALYANYSAREEKPNVHFMIAEGDICVMEFDARFKTHDGDSYHNQYCIVIRVRDGKISEVREHADTLYSDRVCMGTPDKRAGVLERLAKLRAEAGTA